MGQKSVFAKVTHNHLGYYNKCFNPFSARGDAFWPMKIPKCFENGPFLDQRWVKNGSKKHFSKKLL